MPKRSGKKKASSRGVARGKMTGTDLRPRGMRPSFRCPREWLPGLLLVGAIVVVYSPVGWAGFIWDDNGHITKPELQSWHGLWRIWTDLGATQQYYPLVHSLFWVEHALWGDAPLGYHLVNVALFAASALLLVRVLQRLEIPGAWLAAAIFALHPVQVESVAWATELKNMLSGLFYFAAALAYLDFDRTRRRGFHLAALTFFILGLLSKSVIATFPAALLVVFWWKRGTLSWKQDVRPLIPFFIVGIGSGLFTAWVEKHYIGAEGAGYDLTLVQRTLVAGHDVWFYFSKVLWPEPLIFIYPRWDIAASAWWLYLFPVAALGAGGALLALARRWRGPLAGFLYFVGTLFPVLGYLNVYPFRYSFVADHFQYLACLGIIVPVAAGLTLLAKRIHLTPAWLRTALALVLLLLGLVTWNRAWTYQSEDLLWRDTLTKNPSCWMAHNNLGLVLFYQGHVDEATSHFQTALSLFPDYDDAHYNLGLVHAHAREFDAALAEYHTALSINPKNADAHRSIGIVLAEERKFAEAIPEFEEASRLQPHNADDLNNLGSAYYNTGRWDEAVSQYQAALAIDPDLVLAHVNLGTVLARQGKTDDASVQLEQAVQIAPGNADARSDLGNALAQKGQLGDAIAQYRMALDINPDYTRARSNFGKALLQNGQTQEAIAQFQKVLQVDPADTLAQKGLAEAQTKGHQPPAPQP